MTYIICGLNGDLQSFNALKEKAKITDRDVIYPLGGLAGGDLELLTELSMMANAYPIMSVSDYKALRMLGGFDKMLKNGGTPDEAYIAEMQSWVLEGGKDVLDAFRELDGDMREGIIDDLSDFALFEEADVKGKEFIILPRGLSDEDIDGELYDLEPSSFVSVALDMNKVYFEGKITVTADASEKYGKITRVGDNICVAAGQPCALRLEDMAEFYV